MILNYFSLSKEFLDAQRLAMHAFMSRKGGLRAQHLGLLKALCVMFGWNSVLPSDTPRWFPETLSTTEASAQKQDLIIWPPVVIVHNISITSNNSNGEGPITVEALGQYLRGMLFFFNICNKFRVGMGLVRYQYRKYRYRI
ncbi:putative XS domain superfamily protein [Helianthus annuus]|nr:putative XS domain superfamily protein [Helianthus annuus]KAJ0721695.1 putative XS domain superfamily protein [Helianthus annuus]